MFMKEKCPYCNEYNDMTYCLNNYDMDNNCEVTCSYCDRDFLVIVEDDKTFYTREIRVEVCACCSRNTRFFYEYGRKQPFPIGYKDGEVLCGKCYFENLK